jgi:hypothetical protein
MCSNDAELYRLAAYVEEHILSEIKWGDEVNESTIQRQ